MPRARATGRTDPPAVAVAPSGDAITPGDELVLSFGQERLWFHHQLAPDSALYNIPTTFQLLGAVDVPALRAALDDFVERHETLRSRMPARHGRPYLVIDERIPHLLREIDLSGRADPRGDAERLVRDQASVPFDLAAGPLLRALLIRISAEEHVLFLNAHHSVDDGWSPAIFDTELSAMYAARRRGERARLDPLPVQYSDYARWQRDLLEGSLLDGRNRHWRELVARPALRWSCPPTGRAGHPHGHAGATLWGLHHPGRTRRAAAGLVGSRETSPTLFMVILTGLNVAALPLVGAARHRRRHPHHRTLADPRLWGVLGFFNNTIALRNDLSGDAGFLANCCAASARVVLGAMEHQEDPVRQGGAVGRTGPRLRAGTRSST